MAKLYHQAMWICSQLFIKYHTQMEKRLILQIPLQQNQVPKLFSSHSRMTGSGSWRGRCVLSHSYAFYIVHESQLMSSARESCKLGILQFCDTIYVQKCFVYHCTFCFFVPSTLNSMPIPSFMKRVKTNSAVRYLCSVLRCMLHLPIIFTTIVSHPEALTKYCEQICIHINHSN